MAPKKGDPKGKGEAFRRQVSGFEQATFVPYNMTDAEREKCKVSAFGPEMLEQALQRLVDGRYKVTFRFDERNNTYACWIISPDKHEDNPNMILSGRGSSPIKSLKQACFMHFQLFDEVWPNNRGLTSPEEYDD